MKEVLLILMTTFFILSPASASEEVFNKQAYCEINAGQSARCEVCNFESYRPIFCQMSIKAKTLYGFWFNGQQHGMVAPGQCMYGYTYARNPMRDPLISVSAQASCRL